MDPVLDMPKDVLAAARALEPLLAAAHAVEPTTVAAARRNSAT